MKFKNDLASEIKSLSYYHNNGYKYVVPMLYHYYDKWLERGLWIEDLSFLEDILDKKVKTVEEIDRYIQAAIHSENHELYLILTKYKHKYLAPAQDEGRFEL